MNKSVVSDFPVVRVGAIDFAATSLQEATHWCLGQTQLDPKSGVAIRLSNAYCVALADRDRDYASVFASGGVTFPDGAPVVGLMRLLTRRSSLSVGRVRGPDLFDTVMAAGVDSGVSHFLIGGTEELLGDLTDAIRRRHPEISLAGTWAPPFGPVDDLFFSTALERIGKSAPDFVWVGLGTPKQDVAALRLAELTGAVVLGVGAAFDFLSGHKRTAPRWMSRFALEWLFRLATEPRRLWRRYLFGNLRFLAVATRQVMKP